MLLRLYEDFGDDCCKFLEYFKREYAGDKLGAHGATCQL